MKKIQKAILVLKICAPIQGNPKKTTISSITYWFLQTDCGSLQYPTLTDKQVIQRESNRYIGELTDVIKQMDLTDICKTLHKNAKEYIFSEPLGFFSKIITYSDTKQVTADIR